MKQSKKVDGMTIELRTGMDAEFTSEILIDGTRVACCAVTMKGCDGLYDELVKDKSGDKARFCLDAKN